jgi:hypothetical protein
VADVIGVSRQPKNELVVIRDASVLLAQADLLVVWLVLGGARWIQRVPWSLCGFAGVGLVFYMHNFREVRSAALFVFVLHALLTALFIAWLRFKRLRIVRIPKATQSIDLVRRRQFTVVDLFVAALAVAIGVSWMLRMQRPQLFLDDAGLSGMLFVVCAPLSLVTLLAVSDLRRDRWLELQIILSALLAIFLTDIVRSGLGKQLSVLYSVHWFVVAATLWIFQMCGYRLVRTTV